MSIYELLVLTCSDEKHAKEIDEKIKQIFSKMIKVIPWGIKDLAYRINKEKKGYYFLYYFEADNKMLNDFHYEYRLNKNIYRFLLINLNKEFKDPQKYLNNKLKIDATDEEIIKFKKLKKTYNFRNTKRKTFKINKTSEETKKPKIDSEKEKPKTEKIDIKSDNNKNIKEIKKDKNDK